MLVLLVQQFEVGVDEVQEVLGRDVVIATQLLQEPLAVDADTLMHQHDVADEVFPLLFGNQRVLQYHHASLSLPRATRGVTVSTSACHQCYCAGSSLARVLNLRALVCGIF